MPLISIADKNADFSDLNTAVIVAEAGEWHAVAAVYSFEHNQFIRIDVLNHKTGENNFADMELFKMTAKQKMVMISTGKTLLIPSALFDKEKVNDLIQFNFEGFNPDTEKVLYNKLNHLNSYLLFTVDIEMLNRLTAYFDNQAIYHRATAFLENGVLFQNERLNNQETPAIFVDILEHSIILSLFHSGKLAFFNQIAFRAPQDLVYFIVKLADEFKLDTKKTDLFLSGKVSFPKDDILQEIKKFFLQVYPFEFTKFFGVSPALKSISLVEYNTLFNLPFCVS